MGGGFLESYGGARLGDPPLEPKCCSRSAGWGHHQMLPLPSPGWGNSSLGGFSLCVT